MSGVFGTSLEWFDFAVYGALSATLFPALFFPEFDKNTALLASFATFGAGMFARPVGGILFGALGDRIGRRNVLMLTFVLMGASSVLIGLLPTYSAIGVAAPMLLVLLRMLQGLGLGGEASGMQVFIAEHAPSGRRGLYGGLIATGSPLAQTLSAVMLTVLASVLSEEAFSSWGWRIPFLLGIALLAVGAYFRRHVEETPAFKESMRKAAENPVPRERALAVVVRRPGTVLKLVLAWAAPSGLFWICVTYAVSYMTSQLGYGNSITFGLLLIANLVSIGGALFGGSLSDRIGRKKTMFIALACMGVSAGCLFPILNTMNYTASVAIITFALFAIQMMTGPQAGFFSEALPTRMRYTGAALGLTISVLIFGAPMPFVAAWIFQVASDGTVALSAIGLGLVVISATAIALIPERSKLSLDTDR